jgi:regulation of enolase protein 1 (concanavalin A-like superfamily)
VNAGLPPGWTDTDIGAPGRAGSGSDSSGNWTVAGGGADIGSASDQFNFVSTPYNSDGSITALITSVQNTDTGTGLAKAGVMFRNDTTAGSINIATVVTATQGVALLWRSAAGGSSSSTYVGGVSVPVWVQLTRSGNNFIGSYSLDGTNWQQIAAQQLGLNGSALAGLAVTAHNNAALNTATFTNLTLTPQTFGVYRELWTNLNASVGNNLAALTNSANNPNWPNNPAASFTHVFAQFETEINTGMSHYGQRVRALVVPPQTGSYIFWIASDDYSQLFLSTGENPTNMVSIASVSGYTDSEQWTKFGSQQSAPVYLQAGSRYFLEALMEQGGGGDNLAVGWQLPNGVYERPMVTPSSAGTLLIPFTGSNATPGIFSQTTNLSVVENQNAVLSVLVTNQAAVSYQWFVQGVSLNGAAATQAAYVVSNASIAVNNNQTFTCVISNAAGMVTSGPMLLTVTADAAPPTVQQAYNVGATNVVIVFSKGVTSASATTLGNYTFTNGLAITGASLGSDNLTVTLTTAPLTYYTNYEIVINGVTSRAATPVPIAANTLVPFVATPYVPADIGSPPIPSSVVTTATGMSVTTTGGGIGGIGDQFNFQYETMSGDFDVNICLAGLGLADVWSEAGLMARASLNQGAAFAASLATPGMAGSFFQSRTATSASATSTGTFPANYPNTWLRLQRVGSVFTGYASYDGQTWAQLGSSTIGMTDPIYLGLATSSHTTNTPTSASFLLLSNTAPNAMVGTPSNPHEPIGPSSRKSPIVFSEIMWKPAPRSDNLNCEFVEIYNSQPYFHDISGYQITCADMNYTFPPGTTLPAGGYLVVAAAPGDITAAYGITNVVGPYNGSLKKSETLELFDEQGALLLTVPYTGVNPWPVATDGTGHSLVLANPTWGEGDPRAWDISDIVGGSPGRMESYRPSPLRSVVINEILSHSENPAVSPFVELYNHSTQTVDLSGCILTDVFGANQYVIPPGTMIAPGGFVSFNASLGFTLNPAGDTIYFVKPDGSRVLDAVQFEAQSDGVSYGRWPDGANDFYPLQARTPGTNNSAILIGNIVINELMYKPISGNDDDQYIELYNQGSNTVGLSNWQFTAGVTFTFPPNASIPPNGYVVVGKNIAELFAHYTNLNSSNTFGNYSGKLSHNGERVALSMPQTLNGASTIYVVEDEVTYGTGGRWGQWAGGGGSSLELIDPHANHRLAANWADSDESQKSQWVDIENTGILDLGSNYESSILHAQIGLLDVGECLIDNVEVDFYGTNCVMNPTFETGLANWSLQGDHVRSSLENSGYQSSYSLHIRCSDKFWSGVNSCQATLFTNRMAAGSNVTLRFKARWLHGWPEALLRLNGNWLEATGPMPVPTNLGTPGAPNSTLVANAGPAMYQVTHTPTVPAANQPVVVTAQVHDPDGLQSFTLFYRIDPSTNYTSVPMNDSGTGGDVLAGDGIFSATIPGQAANTVAAFYLTATDNFGAATRFPALRPGNNEPVREGVVLFGDSVLGESFGTYRMWITQTNATRWANLSDLSNEGNDFTFVSGNRVIYNALGHFSGSPYHQEFDTPTGSLCHYKWVFPDDQPFLGATDFNKIHQPGNGPGDDASLQREQTSYTLLRALGVPWLYRRYVAVYVNGGRRGTLMEDTQVPNGDMVKEYFPNDPDGFLFKMQPWFEFAPQPSGNTINFNMNEWCTLNNYTTTGGAKKAARYRYNYEIRRTPDSANDFTNVYSVIDAANSFGTPNYVANMENLVNMENWFRVFAGNHAAANRDCFGLTTEQNLYGYIGALGTSYSLMMFDFNICLDHGAWGPGQNLFLVNSDDPFMSDLYSNPTFQRMYWRALQELVNGPLLVSNTAPLCNAKYNAFVNDGLSVENPNAAMLPWMASAGTSIASQIAAVNATNFVITSTGVTNGLATISGVAPFKIATILFNGISYPVTWTSLTNWTATVKLQPGTNPLAVTGADRNLLPIAGATNSLSLVYNGSNASPVGQVVINEIMWNPTETNAQFIELYNNSTSNTFDLSNWQLQGLDYVFPAGSELGPTNFLVLTQNRPAFAAAYGATVPVFDTFGANLQPAQLLTLAAPVAGTSNYTTVTELYYDSAAPWPTNSGSQAASLQMIDPTRDNWRAGNWALVSTNGAANPQWVRASATGTATTSLLYIYLTTPGDIYIDDVSLVAGSVPETGPNLVTDGGFESGFPGPWTVSANESGSVLSTAVKHSGNASLHVIATSGGTTQGSSIWQIVSPALTTNSTYTISFWYLQNTNRTPAIVRLSGSGIVDSVTPASPAINYTLSPGASNSTQLSLPAFPPLWINELQPNNLTGITNRAGQRTAWLELYNPTTNTVSLSNLFLANTYTNLTQWAFPSNAVIGGGQFKVIFADGLTGLSTTNELHTSFVLSNATGALALSRLYNGQPQALDYVNYTNIPPDSSYGSYPDGQSFARQIFFYATPGAANDGISLPPLSFISYNVPGSVYAQNFDSLPDPGPASVNSANPVTINGVTYSLSNPFAFAALVVASGNLGGLGDASMAGWYGLADPTASVGTRFGATDGDQTTGGDLSFGLPNSSNRALGLLATSSTGYTAFGVKFLNLTGTTLNYLTVQLTGELWRQSDKPKTLEAYYYIDPTATAAFSTAITGLLPGLNVSFATSAADSGGVAVNGTNAVNQENLGLVNHLIANWPNGAALWLVWEMSDTTGKAQGLGIDNFSFSAAAQPVFIPISLSVQLSGTNFSFNWPTLPGVNYQIEYNGDLGTTNWLPLGAVRFGSGNSTGTNLGASASQQFFRVRPIYP